MIQRFLDFKVSIVTLIGWVVALVGLTFTVSSAYGEQKQKLIYLTERQTSVERKLDQFEVLQREMNLSLARIETELKDRSKK